MCVSTCENYSQGKFSLSEQQTYATHNLSLYVEMFERLTVGNYGFLIIWEKTAELHSFEIYLRYETKKMFDNVSVNRSCIFLYQVSIGKSFVNL